MKILEVKSLIIPDVKVVTFERFADNRGYFVEPFRRSDFDLHPDLPFLRNIQFLQTNESYSEMHVVRGLHFQWNPYMGKLVRTVSGHMIDMVLDIRKNSPTYGKIIAYDMPSHPDKTSGEWIWVPPGFAHGNYFLEKTTIEYSCTSEYSQGNEAGISPFSQDLNWELCDTELKNQFSTLSSSAIVSEKDRKGMTMTEWGKDMRSENFIFGKL